MYKPVQRLTRAEVTHLRGDELLNVLAVCQNILLKLGEKYSKIENIRSKIFDTVRCMPSSPKYDPFEENIETKYWVLFFICLIILSLNVKNSFIGGVIVWGGSFLLPLVIIFSVGWISDYIYESELKRLRPSRTEYYDKNVVPLEKEETTLQEELKKYLVSPEVLWLTSIISEEYLNYNVLCTFVRYIRSGRADSLKEAINLYEEEKHRFNVERRQEAILNATRESAKHSADIARSIAATNADIREIRSRVENIERDLIWNSK